jgi:hypothetical protein
VLGSVVGNYFLGSSSQFICAIIEPASDTSNLVGQDFSSQGPTNPHHEEKGAIFRKKFLAADSRPS